ncbi:thioredoxin family protein [Bacillus sp. FJAT-45350]|uniref:thioredoxin family protein n=1 Tax=Bacillus sp. FJAT-45350 TaxID=2011014 RepID=UPI000BB6CCAE|nr:thioredoxin family protein [Bacillus sp. FJAT-45350]
MKRSINFAMSLSTLLLMIVIIIACSNETQSGEIHTDDSEGKHDDPIVASNGFVFERGERNFELKYEEDFDIYLENTEKLFTVFYATWCTYCQEIDTRLDELLDEFEDLVILNIDIEKHTDLARIYQAVATPTIVYFEEGKDPAGFRGALPTETIIEFINAVE